MSPWSGRQERSARFGGGGGDSSQEMVVRVQFTAHSCETFDSTFIFDGLLEESRCFLQVSGRGTYDGRHEAVGNV